MRCRLLLSVGVLTAVLLSGAGCGTGAPKTVKVSGIVEFDGKPLTKGTITFVPMSATDGEVSRPATGAINDEGKYELSTFTPGDGAIPGKYKVAIVCIESEPSPEDIAEKGAKFVSFIPAGYNNVITSGLTAEIPSDEATFEVDFPLKKDGAPAGAPAQGPAPTTDQFGT